MAMDVRGREGEDGIGFDFVEGLGGFCLGAV